MTEGLPRPAGSPLRKSSADGAVDIDLEGGAGAVEMFLVEKPVLPLAGGVSGLGVGLAIDEGDQIGGAAHRFKRPPTSRTFGLDF